jgi:uncharacterized protein (TIGR02117 family)
MTWQVGCQAAILSVFAVVVVAGCLGPVAGLYPPSPHEPRRVVWVVDHGWHAGVVLRGADVPTDVWPERRDFPTARFLEVAWGDRDFYTAPEGSIGLALKAAFGSRHSVLHVVGFSLPVVEYFPASAVVELELSRPGFDALARFVDGAHARAGEGRAPRLGVGLYGDSGFYPARGRYSLMNTCNTWTASALRAAGCPITPLWATTAGGLLRQVRSLGRVVRSGERGL